MSEASAWAALHSVMLTGAWPRIPGQMPHLLDFQKRFSHQVDAGRMADVAVTNFGFFAHLRAVAENPSNRVGVTATAHRLVLAEPLLPHHAHPTVMRFTSASSKAPKPPICLLPTRRSRPGQQTSESTWT